MPTLVVYGATSFTAQHLLRYLDAHADAPRFDLILAGRNGARVAAAGVSLRKKHEIAIVDLDDTSGVEHLVSNADVIINLAGPYQTHNAEALIAACVKFGKHYVDLTGEAHWLSTVVVPKYDFAASKSGACIVNSCGFESVPSLLVPSSSDLSVYHALRHLQSVYGRDVGISESTSFYSFIGGVSGGTMATLGTIAGIENRVDGEWALVSPSVREDAPNFLRAVYRPPGDGPAPPGCPSVGAFFPGYPFNMVIVRRSWFLSRLLPSTMSRLSNDELVRIASQEPRHGNKTKYEEALVSAGSLKIRSTWSAALWSVVFFVVGGLYFSSKLVRKLMSPLIPKPGQGPSREECENGSTRVTNVALSDSSRPIRVVTRYTGVGDPGYAHTSYILAEAALSLVLPPPEGTSLPPLAHTGGVLTPSTAMGMVLVERLRRAGKAVITSEIVDEGDTRSMLSQSAGDKKTL